MIETSEIESMLKMYNIMLRYVSKVIDQSNHEQNLHWLLKENKSIINRIKRELGHIIKECAK